MTKILHFVDGSKLYYLGSRLKILCMGLSIHYSGRIKDAKLLPNLIEEVKDVAQTYNWKYHIFQSNFVNNELDVQTGFKDIYGISFTPTNSETISFSFLSNGVMVCPARLYLFSDTQNEQEQAYIYSISVKTQYAGVQLHQFIIHFLKYLNSKYINDFNVADESYYWETGDEEKMKSQFKKYNTLIDNFALALEVFPKEKDESMIEYVERLMIHVNGLRQK
ncbi:MAG: hypothetical protein EOO47_02935 [Flavobacterium sp.]|nr:MAG: hypothetical protein EOO47_02935 [Flavobacterium sp.]